MRSPRPPATEARAPHLEAGRRAEDAAARFLAARGLTVIRRNHRCRGGELDLIAREGEDVLVLAEVRLRARDDYGGALASVDSRKQRRLVRAARHLLATQPALARLRIRFDVIGMKAADDGWRVRWVRGAFDAT